MPRPSSDESRAGNLGKLNPKRAEVGRFGQQALRGGMLNLLPSRPEPPAPLNLDEGAGAFHGREAEALKLTRLVATSRAVTGVIQVS